MNDNVLSIQSINFNNSFDIRRFLNALLKMKCEGKMRADCKGDIMNKSRDSEWSFIHRQSPAQSVAALARPLLRWPQGAESLLQTCRTSLEKLMFLPNLREFEKAYSSQLSLPILKEHICPSFQPMSKEVFGLLQHRW